MKLSVEAEDQGIVRVAIEGRVSQRDVVGDVEPLLEVLGGKEYSGNVLLDMSEVTALDSSGVNWLLICQRRIRATGGRFILHSLSLIARNVIKVLNLQNVFDVAEDVDEAVSLVRKDSS